MNYTVCDLEKVARPWGSVTGGNPPDKKKEK